MKSDLLDIVTGISNSKEEVCFLSNINSSITICLKARVELPLAKARGFLLHRLDLRLLPEVIISIGLKSRSSYGIYS